MHVIDEPYNFIEDCKLDCLNNGKCIEYQSRNMCLVKTLKIKLSQVFVVYIWILWR